MLIIWLFLVNQAHTIQTGFDSETVLFSESDIYSKNWDSTSEMSVHMFLSEAFDIE